MFHVLSDLKVWIKIFLAPAVMVVGILILTVAAIQALNQQRDAIADYNNQRVANLEATSRLAAEIADINGNVYKALAWANANYDRVKIETLIKQQGQRLAQAIAALDDLAKKGNASAEEKTRFADALKVLRNYAEAAKGVLDMADDPSYAAMYMAKADASFEALRSTLDGLLQYEQQLSREQYETSLDRFKTKIVSFSALVTVILAIAVALALVVNRYVNRSIAEIEAAAKELNSGDLTRRVTVFGHDEIGLTAKAFNELIEGFQATVRIVHTGAEHVTEAATRLAENAAAIVRSSENQVSSAGAAAAGIEEMSVSIAAVADSAEQVRTTAKASLEDTHKGLTTVSELASEMQTMKQAVERIASSVSEFVEETEAITAMTRQVKEIAEQTNLLALNAAIEAARAGEQGRGFAVVANEVRKLAEKSGESAREIDGVTQQLGSQAATVRDAINAGLVSLATANDHMNNVSGVLREAGESARTATEGIDEIVGFINEQRSGSQDVAKHAEQIMRMAEQNSTSVHSASSDAETLHQMAAQLKSAIDRFRV